MDKTVALSIKFCPISVMSIISKNLHVSHGLMCNFACLWLVTFSFCFSVPGTNSEAGEIECPSETPQETAANNCPEIAENNELVDRKTTSEDKEKRSDLKLPLSENHNKGEFLFSFRQIPDITFFLVFNYKMFFYYYSFVLSF